MFKKFAVLLILVSASAQAEGWNTVRAEMSYKRNTEQSVEVNFKVRRLATIDEAKALLAQADHKETIEILIASETLRHEAIMMAKVQ